MYHQEIRSSGVGELDHTFSLGFALLHFAILQSVYGKSSEIILSAVISQHSRPKPQRKALWQHSSPKSHLGVCSRGDRQA